MNESIKFSETLDTVEGRNFINRVVNFFVSRAREKVKNSVFKPLEAVPAKKLYEKYEFLKDSTSNMELCYLLATTASRYIEYIEDDLNPNLQFPFDCDILFNLKSWFEEIDIRHRYTYEILVLLINKLYTSPYRELI